MQFIKKFFEKLKFYRRKDILIGSIYKHSEIYGERGKFEKFIFIKRSETYGKYFDSWVDEIKGIFDKYSYPMTENVIGKDFYIKNYEDADTILTMKNVKYFVSFNKLKQIEDEINKMIKDQTLNEMYDLMKLNVKDLF